MQMPLKIVWMMNGVQWRVYWQIMQKSWHLRKDIIQTIFLLMTNTKSRLIYNDKFQFDESNQQFSGGVIDESRRIDCYT